ncbi:chromate resistance protein ChrB domain-containing protein [Pseudomonas sp. LS-2]|jgi:hypothetical protein|uniref:chromate resistance protein ChrB domain-containing protein n=1 Tax=Pseudomonas sp. LS-2 TaxID=2315859 RepID=UPI000E744CD9|nr:chromate resistance protein ChrB domain-containing protein [Pseudomonas sp. LS-2]RJX83390.1 chromate resistance protein [Pseudomonas sp. LS-2]
MNNWIVLVMALPTSQATERMRAWRALKACGAAVLRDGVYLLPDEPACRDHLASVEKDIASTNGTAFLLPIVDPNGERFINLFDRGMDYLQLSQEIENCRALLNEATVGTCSKTVRKLRKQLAQLTAIDFFPTDLKVQTSTALTELEVSISRAISPEEPTDSNQPITVLERAEYQGRVWATRKRPWIDRLASAWLIRRFIDSDAQLLWLAHANDCPAHALGFDFDGAQFSHTGNLVTFETLMASFQIVAPGVSRVAALVHYMDVGGIQPPEATGVERVMSGLRETMLDDDQLLAAAGAIFDGLLNGFVKEDASNA